jgi:hypothetical protein
MDRPSFTPIFQTLLNMLNTSPTFIHLSIPLLSAGRKHLAFIQIHPVAEPAPDSTVRAALEPGVLAYLHAFLPLTPKPLISQDDAWSALHRRFDAWEEIGWLVNEPRLVSWEVRTTFSRHERRPYFSQIVGALRTWTSRIPAPAYTRSLTQVRRLALFTSFRGFMHAIDYVRGRDWGSRPPPSTMARQLLHSSYWFLLSLYRPRPRRYP